MPPFSSTGGDLVDQLRDLFDRQRERFAGPGPGVRSRVTERRAGRRSPHPTQAVPLGTVKTMPPGSRPPRSGGPRRNDRAGRGAYTLILGAVLVVGVIALFFAVSWALGTSSSTPPIPVPTGSPTQLPGPAAISPPPPFPSPSPSPSPTLAPPQQRVHVIEGGDTLNRIAQRYGVTVEAIMQANNIPDRSRILRIGERLTIPDTPPASPSPVPR